MYGKVIGCVLLCFVLYGTSGCALMREGNPATTPKTGPGTAYPCGVYGVVCTDEAARLTPDQACCYVHSTCKIDDDGPYCESYDFDPADPTMMVGRHRRARFARHVP